jgi:hypothetical protein
MTVHILKMCVGVDDIAHLRRLQEARLAAATAAGEPARLRHLTRHRPRRAAEIVAAGSLYWIIRGYVRVRQRIIAIDNLENAPEGKRCALVLDPALVGTVWQPRRPHQGWRYLAPEDAPPDRSGADADSDLPPHLAATLYQLGVF